jgi:hypothetical protein
VEKKHSLVDLLTKIQPDPVRRLGEMLKTPPTGKFAVPLSGAANSFPVATSSKYFIINPNGDVGFSEIFLEEHDYGIDLMTKNHPDPFWHLKDKIKTPVHCKLVLQFRQLLDIRLVWRLPPVKEGSNDFSKIS